MKYLRKQFTVTALFIALCGAPVFAQDDQAQPKQSSGTQTEQADRIDSATERNTDAQRNQVNLEQDQPVVKPSQQNVQESRILPDQRPLGQSQNLQDNIANLSQHLGNKVVVFVIDGDMDTHFQNLQNDFSSDQVIIIPLHTMRSGTVASMPDVTQPGDNRIAAEPNIRAQDREDQPINLDRIDVNADRRDATATRFGSRDSGGVFLIIDQNQTVKSVGTIQAESSDSELKKSNLSESINAALTEQGARSEVRDTNNQQTGQNIRPRPGQVGEARPEVDVMAVEVGIVEVSTLIPSSRLIDLDIKNPAGEDLGEIEDLVINIEDGRVVYAIHEFGGFLGIGEKDVIVPWNAYRHCDQNNLLTLDMNKEQLDQFEDVDYDVWPNLLDLNWRTNTASRFNVEVQDYGQTLRLAELKRFDIENTAGEDLGNIDELLLNVGSGNIPYAVISFGGFLGIGDKLISIPWDQFNVDAQQRRINLDIPKDRLENAPSFERNNWPDFNADWQTRVNQYYLR